MLSKNKIKELIRLGQKKFRDEQAVFIAEGNKLVTELLPCFDCRQLLLTTAGREQLSPILLAKAAEIINVSDDELRRVSLLQSPQQMFAVFFRPPVKPLPESLRGQLSLALDGIQDPGNMGTILRLADWFGIENVFVSPHTVDVFNPKVVQASMGAIARVKTFTVDLPAFLQQHSAQIPVYGTFLSGENIYTQSLSSEGIIVMGNEGNGITPEVEQQITQRLLIPSFPSGRATGESLNVGVATAIVCSEFRRRE